MRRKNGVNRHEWMRGSKTRRSTGLDEIYDLAFYAQWQKHLNIRLFLSVSLSFSPSPTFSSICSLRLWLFLVPRNFLNAKNVFVQKPTDFKLFMLSSKDPNSQRHHTVQLLRYFPSLGPWPCLVSWNLPLDRGFVDMCIIYSGGVQTERLRRGCYVYMQDEIDM